MQWLHMLKYQVVFERYNLVTKELTKFEVNFSNKKKALAKINSIYENWWWKQRLKIKDCTLIYIITDTHSCLINFKKTHSH